MNVQELFAVVYAHRYHIHADMVIGTVATGFDNVHTYAHEGYGVSAGKTQGLGIYRKISTLSIIY